MSKLDDLKRVSVIVSDSGDFEAIKKFKPEDATTNPTLILNAATMPHYQHLVDNAIKYSIKKGGSQKDKLSNAGDKLAVLIGLELLRHIPGRVSTEVDARLSFDYEKCIDKARSLVSLYQDHNIDPSRILIKLAATWEGIRAAETLEKEGINCNLTLIFSFAQARACAEAGVYLVSPFVGRIYDWYQAKNTLSTYYADQDPGVQFVRDVYNYYKSHNYSTIVMGASFRKIEQILALSGCDRLTISPSLLNILKEETGIVERKLLPPTSVTDKPTLMSVADFHWQHNQNEMAVNKLSEGIRLFSKDQEKLELMLSDRLKSWGANP
ncbi:transaldolase [Providencia rettgeri]|uniref:transaldolase n=1 Tax=Providencia rettgeri TaxID=587 RepID=UPI001FF8FD85|nr:transaldolase [Providencia rettgeri]